MRHVLDRIALVVLILIALVMIVLVLALVWPSLVFSQTITIYPHESRQLMYTTESIKSEYRAWIEIKADNSHLLQMKAYCRNNSSENSVLRYNLTVQKGGRAGRTTLSQSGSVYLRSQEERCLSKLGLGVSLEDEYEIKLEVYKDGKLVAEDSVFYPRGLRI